MKTVVFSALEVGYAAVLELLEEGADIAAIFTVDDAFILNSAMDHKYFADFSPISVGHRIPLYGIHDMDDPHFQEGLRQLAPELILCLGWPLYVPPAVLALPRAGVVGIHPSRLPERRGASTVSWSLIDGLSESAVSRYYLSEAVCAGDVIAQRDFPLERDDTAGVFLSKMKDATLEFLRDFYPHLMAGTAPRTPQDESGATWTRARRPEDNAIDWRASSAQIHNLVRGCTKPFPGAFTWLREQRLIVWKTRLFSGQCYTDMPPGMIVDHVPEARAFAVATGDHAILVTLVEPEGGEIVSARRFVEETGLNPGTMFPSKEVSRDAETR